LQTAKQKRDEVTQSREIRLKAIVYALNEHKRLFTNQKPFTPDSVERVMEATMKLDDDDGEDTSPKKQAEVDQVIGEYEELDPNNRFSNNLASQVTPEMLLTASEASPKSVFSSHPTSAQFRLPDRILNCFQTYRDEMIIWERARRKISPDVVNSELAEAQKPPKQMMLEIIYNSGAYTISFRSFDAEGWMIDHVQLFRIEAYIPSKISTDKAKQVSYFLSPDSTELTEIRKYNKSVMPDLREKLNHPEANDPTSFLVCDSIRGNAQRRNMIASMPVDSFFWLRYIGEGVPASSRYQVVRDSDWYQFRPADPLEARTQNIDREVLGGVMRKYGAMRQIGIEEDAEVSYLLPRSGYAPTTAAAWLNLTRQSYFERSNFNQILRVWGSLPAEFKVKPKRDFEFGDLPQNTKDEITFLYYHSFFATPLISYQDVNSLPEKERLMEYRRVDSSLLTIPTSVLPNGIPYHSRFQISSEHEPMLICDVQLSNGVSGPQSMTPEMVGQSLFFSSGLHSQSGVNFAMDKDKIRLGKRLKAAFSLQITKDYYAKWNMSKVVTESGYMSLSQLPEDIRKKIQEGYDEAKRSSGMN
jgi:hypothetical protein